MEEDGRAVLVPDFREVIDGDGSCLRNDDDRFLLLHCLQPVAETPKP